MCTLPVLSSVWDSITNVRISENAHVWKWRHTSNGLCTFKFAWCNIRLQCPCFDLHSVVLFPCASPKMSCCLLKGCFDRLPTKARLKKHDIIDYETCALCDSSPETRNHLFFDSPYSRYLRELCTPKLNISEPMGDLIHETEQIKNSFRRKEKTIYFLELLSMSQLDIYGRSVIKLWPSEGFMKI